MDVQWVSTPSLVCMVVSIGVMLLTPWILIVVAWLRKKASVSAPLYGILSCLAGFALSGLIWCIYIVIRTGENITTNLPFSYYVLYAVLSGLAAAFLNYFIRKSHYKKHKRPWDSFCFYCGAAFIAGVKMMLPIVENIRLVHYYNHMNVNQLQDALGTASESLKRLSQISNQGMIKGPAYFLLDGLEFLLLFVCFLSMGYLLEQTMKKGKLASLWFLLLLIFQLGTELPALLERDSRIVLESREIILTVIAALATLCAFGGSIRNKQREKSVSHENRAD